MQRVAWRRAGAFVRFGDRTLLAGSQFGGCCLHALDRRTVSSSLHNKAQFARKRFPYGGFTDQRCSESQLNAKQKHPLRCKSHFLGGTYAEVGAAVGSVPTGCRTIGSSRRPYRLGAGTSGVPGAFGAPGAFGTLGAVGALGAPGAGAESADRSAPHSGHAFGSGILPIIGMSFPHFGHSFGPWDVSAGLKHIKGSPSE